MARVVLRSRTAPEPASRMPLAWGDYPGRYLAGLVLLIGGAALVVQTNALTLGLGLLGSVLHAAGWAVQPGRPVVRAAVAVPAVLVCWCTITGAKAMWVLAFLLAFWLLLRRRPARAYWTLALPLGLGLLIASLPPEATDKTVAFWSVFAMVAAGAWIARELALKVRVVHTNRIASVPTEGRDTP
jgi:hypothetical protein